MVCKSFVNMSAKRKLTNSNRFFNSIWEEKYLFVENKSKPQCLVCLQLVSVPKEYNVKRHYETHHKNQYEKYEGAAREAVVKDLKSKYDKQMSCMTNFTKTTFSDQKASYEVALILAKNGKAFRDGEIVKECSMKMALAFGDKKRAKHFETVPLSHQTVARRVMEISEHVSEKVKGIVQHCKYYSLALDESTDVCDVNKLLIFIRTIDENFTIHEELLQAVPLHGTAKGSDIYNSLVSVANAYGGFEKCSSVVTDGAPAMVGRKTGLVGLLKTNGVNCPTLHCIIHQEVLCTKALQMSDIMSSVMAIVNIIRGGNKAQRHRKFVQFLNDLDAKYDDVPLYSKVRWLSAGNTLQHFFSLRKEILFFLRDEVEGMEKYEILLSDEKFIASLAFVTDFTSQLNILNKKLQQKDQNICILFGHIEAFRRKLKLLKADLQKNVVTHFASCQELHEEGKTVEFSAFADMLDNVSNEFDDRFAEFNAMKEQIELFIYPMEIEIETQATKFQLELCDLQSDPFLQSKKNERNEAFWKLVSNEQFPKLRDFALRMLSMFGSTYICESTFSVMKRLKFHTRNRLGDETLDACLRLSTTIINVDIERLINDKK